MRSANLGVVLVLATLAVSAFDGLRAVVGTGQVCGRVISTKNNQPLPYANVMLVGTTMGAMSLSDGRFCIKGVPAGTYTVKAMMIAYAALEKDSVIVKVGETTEVELALVQKVVSQTEEIVVTGEKPMVQVTESRMTAGVTEQQLQDMPVSSVVDAIGLKAGVVKTGDDMHARGGRQGEIMAILVRDPLACGGLDREGYDYTKDNPFLVVVDNPLSTFSIDVDRASYGNMRRFVRQNTLPPRGAIRIEELINYFEYEYDGPKGGEPFAIHTEVAGCPWSTEHRLVRIGLQGKRIDPDEMPPNNLVFLIDVSGSMRPANKLPLIKSALPLLVMQLRDEDRVAIVVYAGSAGLVLDSTPGSQKRTILDAIERLESGGSTAGAAGIVGAYEVAQKHFIKKGNNRVILATDGDFNVGVTSDDELVRLIEDKRKSGVFLTVLGVGEGNLQDAKMEKLADYGNGNYAYLDDLLEAQKVLVHEMGGTLFTIAKDVKIQVEFNPARVKSYRLIGYENRVLAKEDFADDKKDAGELGAGHTVTALYQIEVAREEQAVDAQELRYVNVAIKPDAYHREEIVTVRLRFKDPDGDKSRLVERTARDRGTSFRDASTDFRFVSAVAELGMLLRDSEFKGSASFDHVVETAKTSKGQDASGYRAEFVELAETCKALKPEVSER